MQRTRAKARPRGRNVQEDWFGWMPAEKDGVFDAVVAELDTSYSMLSVALNEAFAVRDRGALPFARRHVMLCPALCDRLAGRISRILRALEEHGRNFGTLPNAAPLNPVFFHGAAAQRAAVMNSLLFKVLFKSRTRFFAKLHALTEIAEDLQQEFRRVAEEIAEGASVSPTADWQALDELHFDLNTCLRETMILLKSFLRALPDEELPAFRRRLQAAGA